MGKSTNNSNIRRSTFYSRISRLKLWRWHRRLGLVSAVFVILLSSTGLLLNHGNGLGLDQRALPRLLLSSIYGLETPLIRHFEITNDSLNQVGDRDLFLGFNNIGECQGQLVGALSLDSAILAGCSNALLLFTVQGQLVDKVDGLSGLPQPIQSLGLCDQQACFLAASQTYFLDLDTMAWQTSQQALLDASIPSMPPDNLIKSLLASYGSEITWERGIQDLHSGRWFGPLGPWIMDVMAILFMIIASTGVIMWSLGKGRKS